MKVDAAGKKPRPRAYYRSWTKTNAYGMNQKGKRDKKNVEDGCGCCEVIIKQVIQVYLQVRSGELYRWW